MKIFINTLFCFCLLFLSGCQDHSSQPKKIAGKNTQLPMCTNDEAERDGIFIDWIELGSEYNSDNGSESDYQKALCLYKKAAEIKNAPEAQYNIGMMYFDGRGVPKDLQQAQHWFLKAANAEKSLPPANFALGSMYLDGNGVKQDYQQAIEWLEKAGTFSSRDYRYTSANSYLLLGKMYYHGMGTAKDNKTAFAYLWLSSRLGNEEAKHDLDIIQKKLSRAQLKEAMKITNQLNKKYHILLDNPFPAVGV